MLLNLTTRTLLQRNVQCTRSHIHAHDKTILTTNRAPQVSPPSVPRTLHDMMIPDSPSLATSVPHLESPHPTKLRRRLSKVLLGESDSNINLLNCPGLPIDSDSQDDTCTLETSINKAIAEPEPKSAKQKWMDYLESFQESTPNVEVQMEEFVRVPSQLEALLTFGFLICIDSYLYILTMLPIKFLWSITLLLRSFLNKNGGYAFHRRYVYISFIMSPRIIIPLHISRNLIPLSLSYISLPCNMQTFLQRHSSFYYLFRVSIHTNTDIDRPALSLDSWTSDAETLCPHCYC